MTLRIVEQLECRLGFGRSVAYGLRRHRAVYRARYEAALAAPARSAADLAERGRVLRLLGRDDEARDRLDEAIAKAPDLARAYAYRFELGLARAVRDEDVGLSDIDRAAALEPRNAWWRAWRAIGSLSSVPYRADGPRPAERARVEAASRDALKDASAAAALSGRCALAPIAAALAYDNLARAREMIRALGRAIAAEPGEGWLYLRRAAARARLDGKTRFTPDDERALLLDEGCAFARFAGRLERFPARAPYWALAIRADFLRAPPSNDFPGALRELERVVARAPGCSWAQGYYSRALATAGRVDEALAAAGRAARLSPRCGWLRVWRGELLRRGGRLREALRDLEAGLALDPGYEFGYAARGGARRALGDVSGALADLDVAVELSPSHAWAQHERSLALRALGRVPEALSALEAACRLDPKFGWCRDRDATAAALSQLDGVLRADAANAAAFAWRGETKLGAGDADGARRDLEACLRLEPGRAWARAWLGRALSLLGDQAGARRELGRAIALDPGYANAHAWRGRARLAGRDAAGAIADLRRAVRLDARSAWALAWLGEALAAARRWSAAAESYRRALALNPADARAWFGLARALERSGRRDEAKESLARALKEGARWREIGREADAAALFEDIAAVEPILAAELLRTAA